VRFRHTAIWWLTVLCFALVSTAEAQSNEWTWMSGSSAASASPGVYGTLGKAAASNVPGARVSPATWTDSSGHLWLFGGTGLDSTGALGYLNDLWEFDVSSGEWTWVGGSSTANPSGDYGTQSTASANSVPGGRDFAVTWIDSSGNLWLFGGLGYDADGVLAYLNDLWQYNPGSKMWTWISGSNGHDQSGIYGTLGEAAAANVPGARELAFSWMDSQNRLWLFGGGGWDYDSAKVSFLNDLWMFDPSTSEWTWMGGSDTGNAPGVYGVVGQATASNVPGSREAGQAWTDSHGRFWLFGGSGPGSPDNFNDLWLYDPSTNEWAWEAGSSLPNQLGVYGTLGDSANGNTPGARYYPSGWIDTDGNLWLFGGAGYYDTSGDSGYFNDLWKFNPANNEWAWVSGSDSADQVGVYGTLGVAADGNAPGARGQSGSWTGSDGRFWLMGGYGVNSEYQLFLNDLWVYIPAETQPAATPIFSPAAGTYNSAQTVTISDATQGAAIYYTTNGTTPTTGSTLYTSGQAITVSSTETIEAIAVASGYSPSAVASAVYTITLPGFTLASSPSSVTVAEGSSATSTITLTDVGGFTGTVTLVASGLPSGVTAAFASGSTTGTQVLTLTASASAAVTSSPVMVTVNGTSGTLSETASIALTVSGPPFGVGSGGTTSITVTPGATTGNTGTVSVLGTAGFSGAVNMTCTVTTSMVSVNDMPTCTLNPTSVTISGATTETSMLTVSTSAATTAKNDGKKLFWPMTGGTALAVVLCLAVPKRRHNWLVMLAVLVLLGAVDIVGCGSNGGGRTGGGGNPGTTAGAYTITVTGNSGTISNTVATIALTVN
jgi:N-acetylneuraminic acid mutarotase